MKHLMDLDQMIKQCCNLHLIIASDFCGILRLAQEWVLFFFGLELT